MSFSGRTKTNEAMVFKITDYTEKLLQRFRWSASWRIRLADTNFRNAKNWIGKSEGAEVDFKIVIPAEAGIQKQNDLSVKVFTTRLDTIFGATYLVLAPEHSLVASLLENHELRITNHEEVENYLIETKKKQS